jgi:alkylation response protein AidB-like acyl-CoA dehydrogenase
MPLDRPIFESEHELFRETCKRFMEKEVVPYHADWEKAGQVPREIWVKAAQAGLLLPTTSADYGGSGGDFRFGAVLTEEVGYASASGLGIPLHNDIIAPYIENYGSEDIKRAWLPKMASAEAIGAICMTEPGTGSDLQGVKTTAKKDGNEYVINGQKTFITNGQNADIFIVVCKTDPELGAKGTSLILVEADRDGFSRGRNLDKIGLKAQDTSELFFDNVRVPQTNILGEENQGFRYLMEQLPRERLLSALRAIATVEAALEWTVAYTKERKAFGSTIFDFQNTKFKLAEVRANAVVGRAFIDRCIEMQINGTLDLETAAIAKLWASEVQGKAVDECLQLFGGYGYMWEYPIARLYADARINRIYAGSSEVMKLIISRHL